MHVQASPWVLAVVALSLLATTSVVGHAAVAGSSGPAPSSIPIAASHAPGAPLVRASPTPPTLSGPLVSPVPLVLPSSVTIIWPNGTISNGSAPISHSANVYTVTADFTGALLVERNGSLVNGAGHELNQSASAPLSLEVVGASNVTVENFLVSNATIGIAVLNSQDVRIEGNTVFTASFALVVQSSSQVQVADNEAAGGAGGYAYSVTGLTWVGNAINASTSGVVLASVSNATISSNLFIADTYGVNAQSSDSLSIWGNNVSFSAFAGIYLSQVGNARVDWNNGTAPYYFLYFQYASNIAASRDSGPFSTYGAYLYSDTNVSLDRLNVAVASQNSVMIQFSTQVELLDSNVTTSQVNGVFATYCQDLNFSRNDLSHYANVGVNIQNSGDVVLAQNQLSSPFMGGTYALYTFSDHTVVIQGNSAPGAAYGEYDVYSTGLQIVGNDFPNATSVAVYLSYSSTVSVRSNNLTNSSSGGLEGHYVHGLVATDNNASGSAGYAFYFFFASSVSLTGNDATRSSDGIALFYVNGFLVANNNASFALTLAGQGLYSSHSTGGLIVNNTAISSGNGLDIEYSTAVQAWGNNVSASYWGLILYSNNQVTVFGNQFWGETYDFLVETNAATRVYHNNFGVSSGWANVNFSQTIYWDSGYPGGGNFWANFTSPDSMSGPSQNLPGRDGVVDSPFIINATNVDHYPLAAPWTAPTITFLESGLPAGMAWSVTVNGTTVESSTPAVVVLQPDAALGSSYTFSVARVPGFTPTPSIGSVSPHGADASVAVTFAPFTSNVTFTATGIAPGAPWNVTVGGKALSSTSASLSVFLANGTYFFVANAAGYAVNPASGSLTVSGVAQTLTLSFKPVVYTVTFTESGLSAGTSWSVTLSGSTLSSTTDTISFNEPNGSYAYSVGGLSGYSATPSNGELSVAGGGASQGVAFTTAASTSLLTSPPVAYGLLAAAIVLGLLAVIGFALWSRARRGRPPAATPWAGPGARPPGATPPPGASGGAPPDTTWKES